jgi:hypothetical protein
MMKTKNNVMFLYLCQRERYFLGERMLEVDWVEQTMNQAFQRRCPSRKRIHTQLSPSPAVMATLLFPSAVRKRFI